MTWNVRVITWNLKSLKKPFPFHVKLERTAKFFIGDNKSENSFSFIK